MWRSSTPVRARRRTPPGYVVPCAPTLHGKPPSGPKWIHEVKHDGNRIIARKDGAAVQLWSRLQNDVSDRFTGARTAIERLPVRSCTLDGEAVVLRPDGHGDLGALRSRAGAASALLIAFDLIELDGEILVKQPLEDRRARLAALLAHDATGSLVFSLSFDDEGADVFAKACALGLEGIVSKRKGSVYQSGRSPYWVKTLNPSYRR